jgi:hypothetical protein
MLHQYVKTDNSGYHWAVGSSTFFVPEKQGQVLVQLQEEGEQVRLALSAEQAEDMATELLNHAAKVRAVPSHHPG